MIQCITLPQVLFILALLAIPMAFTLRNWKLFVIGIVGFALRAAVAYLEESGSLELPWSGKDSLKFYNDAITFSCYSSERFLHTFDPTSSQVYAWLLAIPARVLGSEVLYLRLINAVSGTLLIVQTYTLARRIATERAAMLSAAAVAFFPLTIALSSVLLREALITNCILGAFWFITLYSQRLDLRWLCGAAFCFVLGGMLHGAIAIGVATLLLVVLYNAIAQGRHTSRRLIVQLGAGLLMAGGMVVVPLAAGMSVSKLGSSSDASSIAQERIEREQRMGSKGESGYPAFLLQNPLRPDVFVLRSVYFMGSPFLWSARNGVDQVAALLGLGNLLLFVGILWRFRQLDQVERSYLMVLLFFIAMFSFGTSNVGTAIRHRTKFFACTVCLFAASRSVFQWDDELGEYDDELDEYDEDLDEYQDDMGEYEDELDAYEESTEYYDEEPVEYVRRRARA